jgi:hypothetical protein
MEDKHKRMKTQGDVKQILHDFKSIIYVKALSSLFIHQKRNISPLQNAYEGSMYSKYKDPIRIYTRLRQKSRILFDASDGLG